METGDVSLILGVTELLVVRKALYIASELLEDEVPDECISNTVLSEIDLVFPNEVSDCVGVGDKSDPGEVWMAL